LVSQHYNSSLVDTTVMLMQSSVDTTLVLESDASLNHVVSHLVQPKIVSMKSSADTNPLLGIHASLDHVVSNPIQPTVEEVVVIIKY
jgi:hypothetical protein